MFEYIVGFPDNVLGGDDSIMKMEGRLSQIKSTKNEQRDLSTVCWRIGDVLLLVTFFGDVLQR